MKTTALALGVCFGLAATITLGSVQAEAKPGGCLKYGAAGAVAGHYAHHHGVKGAVAGCVTGMIVRHEWKKKMREEKMHEEMHHDAPAATETSDKPVESH